MQRYEITDGEEFLTIDVAEGTDMSTVFYADDAQTGERLRIRGWLIADATPMLAEALA